MRNWCISTNNCRPCNSIPRSYLRDFFVCVMLKSKEELGVMHLENGNEIG